MGWFPWLSGNDAKVLTVLAYRANKNDGTCYPSQAGIADDCGLSRQQVNRSIQGLVNAGAVKVFENRQRQGRSSIYQLTGALNGWLEHPAKLIQGGSPLESNRFKGESNRFNPLNQIGSTEHQRLTPKETQKGIPPHPNGTFTPREVGAENGSRGVGETFVSQKETKLTNYLTNSGKKENENENNTTPDWFTEAELEEQDHAIASVSISVPAAPMAQPNRPQPGLNIPRRTGRPRSGAPGR